jgi:hypothetical protein
MCPAPVRVNNPSMREQLQNEGAAPATSSPAEFAAFVRDDIKGWAPIVKQSGQCQIEPRLAQSLTKSSGRMLPLGTKEPSQACPPMSVDWRALGPPRDVEMIYWAKKIFQLGGYTKAMDLFGDLQIKLGAPHELMMFERHGQESQESEVFIGVPDRGLLKMFASSARNLASTK